MSSAFLHIYSRIVLGAEEPLLGVISETNSESADIGGTVYSNVFNPILGTVNSYNRKQAPLYIFVEVPAETDIYAEQIAEIRELMIDYAGENILVDGQQFSDAAILRVLNRVLREYNNTPPVKTRYTLKTHPSIDTINLGALAQIFRALSLSDARNQLNYASTDMQLGVRDKWNIYASLASTLSQEYETKKMNEKNWLNIESFNGSAPFL